MNEIATLNDAVRKSLVNLEVKNSLALINCRFEIMMTTKESSKNNFPILNSVFLMIAVEHLNMWKLFPDNS